MDSENGIDNTALYLFLFLSLLSVGNDVYQVYLYLLETEFVKKKNEKMGDYYKLFQSVLCNNVKKVKNKLILDVKDKEIKKEKVVKKEKEVKKEVIEKKEEKEEKEDKDKKKEKKKKKVKQNENNIIDKKPNDEYDKNINILKNIKKKNTD